MTDVRLTALNPVDSQVYPVACNTSGELIVEQVNPGPDLTVTGDLTVNGTSTFDGSISTDAITSFTNRINIGTNSLDDFAIRALNNSASSASLFCQNSNPTGDIFLGTNASNTSVARIGVDGSITMDGTGSFGDGTVELAKNTGLKITDGVIDVYGATSNPASQLLTLKSDIGGLETQVAAIKADGSFTSSGDITCSDNSKGVVLKSPDGTSYRLSVANDGTLSTSAV